MIYLVLYLEFFKTGLFAMGGGLATLPFLYELADKYPWYTASELADMIAVSESTPGAIGINMATYAGNSAGGVLGGIVATLGLITPSIIIIILVSKALDKFRTNKYVNAGFLGLRPAVTGLIAAASYQIVKISIFQLDLFRSTGVWTDLVNWKNALLLLVLTAAVFKFKKHPIVYIVAGAIAGIVFSL